MDAKTISEQNSELTWPFCMSGSDDTYYDILEFL